MFFSKKSFKVEPSCFLQKTMMSLSGDDAVETCTREDCPCEECPCEECPCEECPCEECPCQECSSNDDESEEDASDDFDDENNNILRGKWIYDGSKTIDEMIECLHREIKLLTDLKNDGWSLSHEVSDDFAFITREPNTVSN
jgi:hypothetical protein